MALNRPHISVKAKQSTYETTFKSAGSRFYLYKNQSPIKLFVPFKIIELFSGEVMTMLKTNKKKSCHILEYKRKWKNISGSAPFSSKDNFVIQWFLLKSNQEEKKY